MTGRPPAIAELVSRNVLLPLHGHSTGGRQIPHKPLSRRPAAGLPRHQSTQSHCTSGPRCLWDLLHPSCPPILGLWWSEGSWCLPRPKWHVAGSMASRCHARTFPHLFSRVVCQCISPAAGTASTRRCFVAWRAENLLQTIPVNRLWLWGNRGFRESDKAQGRFSAMAQPLM